MNRGIDSYKVDYFIPASREVLDPLLGECGFTYVNVTNDVRIRWEAGPLYFTVSYLPETSPDYELLFTVGHEKTAMQKTKFAGNSIAVWRLLPTDAVPQIAGWHFGSEEKLKDELNRVWKEAVAPYAKPVWETPNKLDDYIEKLDKDLARQDQQQINNQLLRSARAAFTAEQFTEALFLYDQLPASELTKADQLRVKIAQQHI